MARYIFVCLCVISCVFSPVFAFQEGKSTAQSIDELKAEIQDILTEQNVPGASIALVSKDGTIWAGGVGKADLAGGDDVTDQTLFRVGSISKSFTALAVLMLVEQGLVDLDATVKDVIPEIEFTNRWEETHPVRIVHLMEHTTGFDDIHPREYAYVDNPSISLLEGLAYNPNSRTCRWKPGMHMSYCNSGPAVAAFVVEKMTGRMFEDFAQQNIFDKLGMRHTSFFYPEEKELMAKGYGPDGVTEANYDHIIVRPAGSLNASSAEMANFVRMMINRGTLDGVKLVEPGTIDRMETPTSTLSARAGHTYGYGLGNYASYHNGFLFHGHDGGITGFVSSYRYSSDLGLGFFISVNKPSGAIAAIRNKIVEYLTADIEPPKPPEPAVNPEDLEPVTGYYQLITPRQQISHVIGRFTSIRNVSVEDGSLYAKPLTGKRREIFPVTDSSFRLESDGGATMFNVMDEDGNVIAQWGSMGNYRKVSGLWVYFQIGAALLSLFLMATSVLFMLVWLPRKVFHRMKGVEYLRARVYPLLAVVSLCAGLLPFMISADMVADFGVPTLFSVMVFVFTLIFALFTLLSIWSAYRSFSVDMNCVARIHSSLVTLACTAAMLYLWSCDFIGLRTWAF